MHVIGKIKEIAEFLQRHGIESFEKEAETLVHHATGLERVDIYKDNPIISESCSKAAERLAGRRALREPLAYILGDVEFMDLTLSVGPGVLIPRPETERMAEQAVDLCKRRFPDSSGLNILDLCTGSGCLALSLASAFPNATVYGTDISRTAISFARRNAAENRTSNASFFIGDLFSPLKKGIRGARFDLIMSNPPYIKSIGLNTLQEEIRLWEPEDALDGGADGLEYYRRIIPAAGDYLKADGILILEIGSASAKITRLLEEEGFVSLHILTDYAGIERVIHATWKNS